MPDPDPSVAPPPDPVPDPPVPPPRPRRWRNVEVRAQAERRWLRILALGATLVVVVGLMTLIGWFRPVARPTLIVVGGPAGGPGSLPQWRGDRLALHRLDTFQSGPAEALTIDEGITAITQDSTTGTLVVYVGARAWITPATAATDPPEVRLAAPNGRTLADLLKAVGDQATAARKLVILDVDPPAEVVRVASGGRFPVLVAAEPGQHPVALDALGRSAFGLAIEQGLRGFADASGDGRITVRELAAFTRDRVRLWARQVRDVEQTPVLYDDRRADDWPLALAPAQRPAAPALPKEAPAYPDWLTRAWRDCDAERLAGAGREAPGPLAQFAAAVLQAEQDWRGGLDPAQVRAALLDRLDPIRERISATRRIPHPPPRSLALEGTFGRTPDPEILRATREAFAKRPKPTPTAKPGEFEAATDRAIADFFDPAKLKLRADFDLAHAIFQVAADDPEPTPEAIAFLRQILAIRQPKPTYAEINVLFNQTKRPPASWRSDLVQRSLLLARDAERLDAEPLSLAGGPALLDGVARLRHEAEVVAEAPGYEAADSVARRLKQAQNATTVALARVALVAEARALVDEAASILPGSQPLLDVAPDLARPWRDAAGAARGLADAFGQALGQDQAPLPADLAGRVEVLSAALAGFEPRAIASRIARLARPEPPPGPAEVRVISALLSTPLPTADGRLALWKAGIDAERRLVAAWFPLDRRAGRIDDAALIVAPRSGSTPDDRPSAAPDPDQLAALADLAVIAPWLAAPTPDDPAHDPTRIRRAAEFDRLRGWLAERSAFEARDAGGSEFAAEVARDYGAAVGQPTASVRIDAEPPPSILDPEHPEATVRVSLRVVDSPVATPAPVAVEIAAADGEWLDLEPGFPWPEELGAPPQGGGGVLRLVLKLGAKPVEFPLVVRLRPEEGPRAAPIPPGLVLRARLDSRTAHRLVPLRIEPASYRLRLALTAEPGGKGPDLAEVRLRAAQGKTKRFLTLRNPGVRERTVQVELVDRRGGVEGATTTLTVRPGMTVPVIFGPPPGKPEDGFVAVQGPLSVRLTDPADSQFAIERSIDVGLAAPSDYVRVVSSRFEPAGARNGERSKLDLRLRAVSPIDGPPCPIELTLPPDRIPGLLTPGEGTYTGKLTKLGDEAILSVEGIKVDDRTTDPGFLALTVDGIERGILLRADLATRTRVTPLIPVTRPAIRLRVAPAAPSSGLLPVGIELDSPPEGGSVVVELGQYAATGFRVDSEVTVDSSRGRVRLNPRGPDGALVFEAEVRDPSVSVDLGRIRGRRLIRATLLDGRGDRKAAAEAPVILDDRPPGGVELVGVPKYGLKGGAVALRATADAPESGFREVAFFVGKPVDGKRPAGVAVIPGRPGGRDRTTWTASLPLGDTKLGPAEVSVEFVAGVGLSRFATAALTVVEAIPIEPGKIRGTVVEGNRPQSAFDVRALDEKGAEKGTAKTDTAGRFEITGLPPGQYDVVSAKLTPPTRGTTKATVKPGETTVVEVPMFR